MQLDLEPSIKRTSSVQKGEDEEEKGRGRKARKTATEKDLSNNSRRSALLQRRNPFHHHSTNRGFPCKNLRFIAFPPLRVCSAELVDVVEWSGSPPFLRGGKNPTQKKILNEMIRFWLLVWAPQQKTEF